jgi:hypothetical protein
MAMKINILALITDSGKDIFMQCEDFFAHRNFQNPPPV